MGTLFLNFAACSKKAPECGGMGSQSTVSSASWRDVLTAELPLLGHRNWIVVTDMAYPLQTGAGIETVDTGEDYMSVLEFVYRETEKAPHVKAIVYQDRELTYLREKDVPGIDALRGRMQALLGDKRTFVPHEELIDRLDETGRKFHVVILKSTLTVPYTSAFFELDCNYWDGGRENALRRAMADGD
ncbi:MAG: hypothetical protein LBP64_06830 [Tannerella sp.]|nr:hypothetical protein [Tannerella sp.]